MMGGCLLHGWTEKQFWSSSYRAVYNLLTASANQESRRERMTWEQTRAICAYAIAPYRKKSDTGPVFELPWDHEEAQAPVSILTQEEIRKIFEKRDRRVLKKIQNGKRPAATDRA